MSNFKEFCRQNAVIWIGNLNLNLKTVNFAQISPHRFHFGFEFFMQISDPDQQLCALYFTNVYIFNSGEWTFCWLNFINVTTYYQQDCRHWNYAKFQKNSAAKKCIVLCQKCGDKCICCENLCITKCFTLMLNFNLYRLYFKIMPTKFPAKFHRAMVNVTTTL